MTKPRRFRPLNEDERRLWAHVARGVTPLKGRTLPDIPEPPVTVSPPAPPAEGAPPVAKATKPSSLPPLAPVERKVLLALKRGSRHVDGVIDLHGLRQDEAHASLLSFLRRSQALGHAIILVITGKGAAASGHGPFDERGVLRRVVPHWLRLPDFRPLVLGFEEAAPHHGGSGALYVRLRRRRNDRGSS